MSVCAVILAGLQGKYAFYAAMPVALTFGKLRCSQNKYQKIFQFFFVGFANFETNQESYHGPFAKASSRHGTNFTTLEGALRHPKIRKAWQQGRFLELTFLKSNSLV